MKKFSIFLLAALTALASCNPPSNTAKGGMIGGGGGAALGALIGGLIGHNGKGAAIGAAVGATVGTGTGVIIGNRMDKAKKAAEAAKAAAELKETEDGLAYVKVTFDSGLLFQTGKSALSAAAVNDLATFAKGLDPDMDLYVMGFTDNAPWKGVSAAVSQQKNQTLSLERAQSVSRQLQMSGVAPAQLQKVDGLGEQYPAADNATADGKAKNRRVEVYVLPSKAMIEAANTEAGK